MDFLWTPWRYRYIADTRKDEQCVFCEALALKDDTKAQIVLRGKLCFVILNRFPYTSGHVMIVPYEHVAELYDCDPQTLSEMMQLAQRIQKALNGIYHPQGFNLGMNLGRCAGAGVTGHLHLHLLPRWTGDANFMSTVSETRLEPEDLAQTFDKLRKALGA
ncbi:MAG TPA: HIT domain-containing protein [Candidatus Acidoferrales bacterium]|nr:HIT domain-containing protein [Candidatus Acidoferrales bacterium]